MSCLKTRPYNIIANFKIEDLKRTTEEDLDSSLRVGCENLAQGCGIFRSGGIPLTGMTARAGSGMALLA